MTDTLDIRRRRAAYRAAHRGTKEMDWLLGKFATARLDSMDEAALTEFENLLAAPDPELQHWIMEPSSTPDDRYAALVKELRVFHKLAAKT